MAARLNSSLISRIGVGTNMSSGSVRRTDTALYKNVLYLFIYLFIYRQESHCVAIRKTFKHLDSSICCVQL